VSGNQTHQNDVDDRLTALITAHQHCLYLYIYSLVHRADDATDVLQETNLALWRDAERSLAVAEFRPWAYRVAYHQVLAYRKRRSRDRLQFDDSLLSQLAGDAQASAEQSNAYQEALQSCSRKLPLHNQQLLAMRYTSAYPLRVIAEQLGSSVAAVTQSLHRIRVLLLKCIRSTLVRDDQRREEQP
jgi:RNA polymerase sigma-70 factor, ECF subfamily